jgi:hypothetical protein
MDSVKPVERERERIRLVELERIVGLGLDVDADNLKARTVVAHRSAASAAEQVEKSPTHSLTFLASDSSERTVVVVHVDPPAFVPVIVLAFLDEVALAREELHPDPILRHHVAALAWDRRVAPFAAVVAPGTMRADRAMFAAVTPRMAVEVGLKRITHVPSPLA